jgi:ABC-type lipoprotein release transport system permease subunit
MPMLPRLAWRNIWRNRRRSILTILAVLLACFYLIVQSGMDRGSDEENIRFMVNLYSGAMQLQREGYLENPSLQRSFKPHPPLLDSIRRLPGVRALTPRLETDGLIAFGDHSLGAAFFGVDPRRERGVATILDRVDKGELFTESRGFDIAVGRTLLANLNATIGDTVVLLSQGFDGVLGNLRFRISGSLKTGSSEMDGAAVFIPLETAQELCAMYGRVTAVAIAVDDVREIEEVRGSVQAAIAGRDLAVPGWDSIMPDVKQAAELNEWGGKLFIIILVVVVGFGILNTILVSVTERFREFGVLLALGIPQYRLVAMVLLETVFILLIGMIAGNALAYPVNAWIEANPISLGGEWAAAMEQYGYQPKMFSTTRLSLFLVVDYSVALMTLVLALYPLFRVWKLEALKGIRHT